MSLSPGQPSLIVVGASLGGCAALSVLLRALPPDFRLPVVVVQHRTDGPDDLAEVLQRSCAEPVREIEDKDPLRGGCVHLAPADYHVLVDRERLYLSTDARVQRARPSIDVLFMSAAESHGAGTLGVILTGESRDGSDGALEIKRRGGRVIVQDPATAECKTMPAAAIASVSVDRVLSLEQIAATLASI